MPTFEQSALLVLSAAALAGRGVTRDQLRAELAERRWQRFGAAIVLQDGPLTRAQRWRVGLVNTGPQAMLAAFSAVELAGLRGWERDEVHVLAPPGSSSRVVPGLAVRLHRSRRGWPPAIGPPALPRQPVADAVLLAAASFSSAGPGCGLLAAAIGQRLVAPVALERSLLNSTRLRHRATLLATMRDMTGGPQALHLLNLAGLCRRFGLPAPFDQRVRVDPAGRRRYLLAGWRRPDGLLVVLELDGAVQLDRRRWWAEPPVPARRKPGDVLLLRLPSAAVRAEPRSVADQLRQLLLPAGCPVAAAGPARQNRTSQAEPDQRERS